MLMMILLLAQPAAPPSMPASKAPRSACWDACAKHSGPAFQACFYYCDTQPKQPASEAPARRDGDNRE